MSIEALIEQIETVAERDAWEQLPALDRQLRQAFTDASTHCAEGEEGILLALIERAQRCYQTVIKLCERRQQALQSQRLSLQKSHKAALKYRLAS